MLEEEAGNPMSGPDLMVVLLRALARQDRRKALQFAERMKNDKFAVVRKAAEEILE
ncbi:hypothetical protein JXM67_07970 [candidate division WOR-3 bacterium]|nr:hypothetical protein [candidate division WOR-3 bacterium]